MSVSKKRSADDVGFRDDGDAEMMTDRKQRIKVSSPSKKAMQNSKFMQDKTSLYQQGMEELVEDSKKALEAATSPEEAVLISCEYSRLRQELKRCYNPKPGHLVAMGNDDCLQMGIAPSADADKETEYPPTFVNTVGSRVVHVAGGGLHSVALTVEGQVYTFGCNDDFALGREEEDENKMHLVSPIISGFKAVDHNQIIAVGAGDSHSLFLSIRGNVYQCGMYKDVDSGKFRDVAVSSASPKGNNKHPVMVSLPGPVVDIKAGASWNAALLEDGSLYTWGMG
jgi:alpha-tubulin suppressor-like RCC1 family protein